MVTGGGSLRFLKMKDSSLVLDKKTYIMGILNIANDSIEGIEGYSSIERSVAAALNIEREGADILHIECDRDATSETLEYMRLLPVIEELEGRLRIPISVNVNSSYVAKKALLSGVKIINGKAPLSNCFELMCTAAEFEAAYVITHNDREFMKQSNTLYYMQLYFQKAIELALKCGIDKNSIILNPGFDINKTLWQNLDLINGIETLAEMGFPIMFNLSRMEFLGQITGQEWERRDVPTIAANSIAISKGVDFVAVHNVKAHISAVKLCDAAIRGIKE